MRLILISLSLSFSFSSLSSTAKIGLFLFSLLEVSAFYSNSYCRYHQTTTIKTTTIINRHDDNDVLSNVIIKSMAITDRISSLLLLNQKGRNVDEINQRKKKKRKCLCPPDDEEEEDEDDEDELLLSSSLLLLNEDRREVLFAMMGSLWSISGSGGATGGAAAVAAAATATAFNPIQPAFATYGMDAKIELPDVIAGMNERQNKQCLVESLGNRECLVYKESDPNKLLYKGSNSIVLIDRIQLALNSLDLLPPLVEKKKWNEINGILTGGPMGQLSLTLNLLSKDNNINSDSDPDPECIKLIRKIKEDMFAIGTATTQRQCNDILIYNDKAKNDIKEFILLLS